MTQKKSIADLLIEMNHALYAPRNPGVEHDPIQLADQKTVLSDAERHALRLLLDREVRLFDLMTHLIDYAKIEAGQMEFHLEHFDLPIAIIDVLRPFKTRVTLLYDETLPKVYADEYRVQQTLHILVDYLLKRAASVDVVAAHLPPAVRVMIQATDPHPVPTTTDKDPTQERSEALALSVARHLATLQHGTLDMDVDEMVFRVTLPLASAFDDPGKILGG